MKKENNKMFPGQNKEIDNKLPKIAIFISGTGTNMHEIIKGVKSGEIMAEIVAVVSNKAEARGLQTAKDSGLSTVLLSSKGRLGSSRPEYERELLNTTLKLNPKIVVLAGWMLVLGDEFLKGLEEKEISVINLHPALLTQEDKKEVMTSFGKIPVIRGVDAIKRAYDSNLPVSGVTVHKVVSGNDVDVGPIILQEEVKREKSDTLSGWEEKMHKVEHRLLPMALSKILEELKEKDV